MNGDRETRQTKRMDDDHQMLTNYAKASLLKLLDNPPYEAVVTFKLEFRKRRLHKIHDSPHHEITAALLREAKASGP